MAHRILPFIGPLLVRSFNTRRKIDGIEAPLLVIHGTDDRIIPFKMGRELYEIAPQPKQFWEVRGATHNDIVEAGGAAYRQRLAAFYAELAGGG